MPVDTIVDPCCECSSKSTCKLPLNCHKYLEYKRAVQDEKERQRNLQRCKFTRKIHPPDKMQIERDKALAKECPWRKPDGEYKMPESETERWKKRMRQSIAKISELVDKQNDAPQDMLETHTYIYCQMLADAAKESSK